MTSLLNEATAVVANAVDQLLVHIPPQVATYLTRDPSFSGAPLSLVTLNYKPVILAIASSVFIWEQYLAWRQYSRLCDRSLGVPNQLKAHIDDVTHTKSVAYHADKAAFKFFSDLYAQVENYIIIIYNLLPLGWSFSHEILIKLGLEGDREILQSIVFLILYTTVNTVLNLPLSIYSTFVVEERHGFNKNTPLLFFTDVLKELVLNFVLMAPLTAGFIQIVKWGGPNFFFYVWLFVFAFQTVMLVLYPTVIAPLFNKFTPLPEGSLKTQIEALAKRLSFPLTKIYVIDGSRRSSHSNAYFTGLFKDKRIVLFDTLLEQTNEKETVGILAHEIGHWSMAHLPKKLVTIQLQMFGIFALFSSFVGSTPLFLSFGFNEKPIIIGMMLFLYIYQPFDSVFTFLFNYQSRMMEFQADNFAKKLGYAPVLTSGLIKIHTKNLGNLNPDPLYSAYHYSHPPLVERLAALEKGGDKSQ